MTAVVSAVDDDVVLVHFGGALAAPLHTVTVAFELVFPVARLRLLTTTTEQVTPWPPAFASPLHWLIVGGAACATDWKPAPASAPNTSSSKPVRASPPAKSRRSGELERGCTERRCEGAKDDVLMGSASGCGADRQRYLPAVRHPPKASTRSYCHKPWRRTTGL